MNEALLLMAALTAVITALGINRMKELRLRPVRIKSRNGNGRNGNGRRSR